MNIKTTLSATEARQDFFNIMDKVEKTNVPFTITINGTPKVVIMNAEEYEGWIETLDIMSNPELVKGIEQGKRDLREGRYITLDDLMEKENLMFVRDKSGQVYDVKNKEKK